MSVVLAKVPTLPQMVKIARDNARYHGWSVVDMLTDDELLNLFIVHGCTTGRDAVDVVSNIHIIATLPVEHRVSVEPKRNRHRVRMVTVAVVLAVLGAVVVAVSGVRGVCPTEDSTGCVWVGPLQGNGRGAVVVNR